MDDDLSEEGMLGAMNPFRIGGDLLHLLSFYFLLAAIRKSNSVRGISIRTQELLFVVFACRYVDLAWERGILYNVIMKVNFLLTTLYVAVSLRMRRRRECDDDHDSFSRLALVAPCAVFAIGFVWYSSTTTPGLFEVLWTFSICLEAVAVLPQLFLLQKDGSVENLTSHYMATLGLYRLFYMMNWVYRWVAYGEWTQWIVWVSGSVQILVYLDFFYHYCRSKRRGLDEEVLLPA